MKFTPYNYCLYLLARREYALGELERKLAQKYSDLSFEDLKALLQKLAEQGLQSDQRYCQSMIRSGYNKGDGPRKIRQKLMLAGISAKRTDQEMALFEGDFYLSCLQQRVRRCDDLEALDYAGKGKLWRYLANRGFEGDQIDYALTHDEVSF